MLVESIEVFKWPEFKAFAKRLGIPDLPTQRITLDIAIDDVVRVTQIYLGNEELAKLEPFTLEE